MQVIYASWCERNTQRPCGPKFERDAPGNIKIQKVSKNDFNYFAIKI